MLLVRNSRIGSRAARICVITGVSSVTLKFASPSFFAAASYLDSTRISWDAVSSLHSLSSRFALIARGMGVWLRRCVAAEMRGCDRIGELSNVVILLSFDIEIEIRMGITLIVRVATIL
jgi:hypothetical protein